MNPYKISNIFLVILILNILVIIITSIVIMIYSVFIPILSEEAILILWALNLLFTIEFLSIYKKIFDNIQGNNREVIK